MSLPKLRRNVNHAERNPLVAIRRPMNPTILAAILFCFFTLGAASAQVKPPTPFGPVPSENQMRWQEMEYYAFIHFGLNTYTDQSWGFGNEDINLFNPTKLDAIEPWSRRYPGQRIQKDRDVRTLLN
jgi:hypothetical protein